MQYDFTDKIHILTTFAADYDCNAYGAGAYNSTACGATAENTTPATNPTVDQLANTGYNVIIPAALGAALVIAGVILLVKRLARRNKT